MKAYKTNLILIFLLLGISPWAFSASAEMSSKHLRLVKDLMNNNLAYSQDATTTNIIEWEEEIVDSLRQKKDYRNMFLMKQMAVYAYSLQAKISEALKKADAMMDEARLMKYNIGISLSYQALGDIYLNAGMRPEAVEEYEKAMKTLQATPHAEKIGGTFLAVRGDVTDFEACKKCVEEIIANFGKIDVLVNNAGVTKDNLLMRMKEDEFKSVIDINLIGTFNVTKNVIPYMTRARSGRIINISSIVGISGNAGQTNYAASKAGIIGFTKSLAKEVASRNILVNAVAPGFIETDMTDALKEEIKEDIKKGIPLKRIGKVEDVANVVNFLASEESSYITGQVINVDGGMLM